MVRATMRRMVTVAIREVAQKRGITTAYQLQKALEVSPSVAAKWFRNDLQMIGIDTLDRLCAALRCKPNDLLRYEPNGADEGRR
jgi:DNA-binding Xre family transcriptional regulator